MKLRTLTLTNYKNISAASYEFDARINCFIGKNGVGKSNVLDAIYHLCFGKGYFNPSAVQNIQFEKDFFLLEGLFEKDEKDEKILCSLKKGSKKTIKRNGKLYDRLADHIGLLPLVIISPADRDLIIEGSSTRRKFIDGIMGQTDKIYLNTLLKYNKVLAQRNALLKYFVANQSFDPTTLSIYDEQLLALGTTLYQKRKEFLAIFIPKVKEHYKSISKSMEVVDIDYSSDLHSCDFEIVLKNNLAKDRSAQFTTAGPHKEDLDFLIHGQPIKKFGSQGQQKSFLIALKLAQFDFIKEQAKVPPIVLLDDVFDKLDQDRVALIMQLVEQDHFGQIFLSDTHQDRTLAALKTTQLSYSLFELS
ncbi:MAG: DNA replication/repair protein RecF [Flavobacteriaceae bacterium]